MTIPVIKLDDKKKKNEITKRNFFKERKAECNKIRL